MSKLIDKAMQVVRSRQLGRSNSCATTGRAWIGLLLTVTGAGLAALAIGCSQPAAPRADASRTIPPYVGRPPQLYPRSTLDEQIISDMRTRLERASREVPETRLRAVFYFRRPLTITEFSQIVSSARLTPSPSSSIGVAIRLRLRSLGSPITWRDYTGSSDMPATPMPSERDGGVVYGAVAPGAFASIGALNQFVNSQAASVAVHEPYVGAAADAPITFVILDGTAQNLHNLLTNEPARIMAIGIASVASDTATIFPGWRPYRPGDPLR